AAVVALFTDVFDAVVAGRAGIAYLATLIANLERRAVGRAAVAREAIAVVAGLVRLEPTVAALDAEVLPIDAFARVAGVVRLELTAEVAAVAREGVAVVARLVAAALTVAAQGADPAIAEP